MQLGQTAEKLKALGVETLAVVASNPERARLYFRFRPPHCEVGADPDLTTHRAYGVPQTALTLELRDVIRCRWADLARELQLEVPAGDTRGALERLDGFTRTGIDQAEAERHQMQFTAQFLVDRDGIVRWTNLECAGDILARVDTFPSGEELLNVARAL